MSLQLQHRTTVTVTATFEDDAGDAFNPTAVTFEVTKRSGAAVQVYTAGDDEEVITAGTPTGTYVLLFTPPDRGGYVVRAEGSWDGPDGLTRYAAQTTIIEET